VPHVLQGTPRQQDRVHVCLVEQVLSVVETCLIVPIVLLERMEEQRQEYASLARLVM